MSTAPTTIADYKHPSIQALIQARGWLQLNDYDRIGAVYAFVKDEMKFGYNRSDDLPASEVLEDGYGQCNTKGNLMLALLRGIGISARFHGFTIEKQLQWGAIPPWIMPLAPARILHSWVEAKLNGKWLKLEGFIIDEALLSQIQAAFPKQEAFSGYGISTQCLQSPGVDWSGKDTYIQAEGIADDFGVYEHPDEFYAARGTNTSGLKRWMYQNGLRHLINRHVKALRSGQRKPATPPKSTQPRGAKHLLAS